MESRIGNWESEPSVLFLYNSKYIELYNISKSKSQKVILVLI